MSIFIISAKLAEWIATFGVDLVDYNDIDVEEALFAEYIMQMGAEDWLLFCTQGTQSCYLPLSCVVLGG